MTEEYSEIREKFFSFLLKKTFTTKQAEEFLLRSKVPEEYRNSLMTEAQNIGLIDDLTFAKLFVEGHLHWGNAKIIYELNSKGISREKIEEVFDQLEESQSETVRASELFESFKRQGMENKKITSRLLSRGFSHRAIREAIS